MTRQIQPWPPTDRRPARLLRPVLGEWRLLPNGLAGSKPRAVWEVHEVSSVPFHDDLQGAVDALIAPTIAHNSIGVVEENRAVIGKLGIDKFELPNNVLAPMASVEEDKADNTLKPGSEFRQELHGVSQMQINKIAYTGPGDIPASLAIVGLVQLHAVDMTLQFAVPQCLGEHDCREAPIGAGFDDGLGFGSNYCVGYVFGPPVLNFADSLPHEVAGLFVTNSTYAALSMEHGDAFSKKFGGEGGADPDYFKLIIWGRVLGSSTDSVEYFLADYRFENDTMDYLIKTWQWIDLSSLGKVDSLMFVLESSDMGDWGMNTPGFFCIDNLYVVPDEDPVGTDNAVEVSSFDLLVYPNPSKGRFMIALDAEDVVGVKVFNLFGALIYEDQTHSPGEEIDISDHPAGSYLIRLTNNQKAFSRIIQKQ